MATLTGKLPTDHLDFLEHLNGQICVSIVFPLRHLQDEKKSDRSHALHLARTACNEIKKQHPAHEEAINKKFIKIIDEINFDTQDCGLGIYVSEDFSYHEFFPCPVTEKIVIAKDFELRELLYKWQYDIPYCLLYIDAKGARLFKGSLKNLEEINDDVFPVINEEERSYFLDGADIAHNKYMSTTAKHSLSHNIEFENFVLQVDEALTEIAEPCDAVILCGEKHYTNGFLNRSSNAEKIVSIINSDCTGFTSKQFMDIAWPEIMAFLEEKMQELISELREKVAEGLIEVDIPEMWEAITSGNGEVLLVEKDFHIPANPQHLPANLKFDNPKATRYFSVDLIKDMMMIMLRKNQRVIVVPNGMLNYFHKVALITRI